jgi:hypothetical protein
MSRPNLGAQAGMPAGHTVDLTPGVALFEFQFGKLGADGEWHKMAKSYPLEKIIIPVDVVNHLKSVERMSINRDMEFWGKIDLVDMKDVDFDREDETVDNVMFKFSGNRDGACAPNNDYYEIDVHTHPFDMDENVMMTAPSVRDMALFATDLVLGMAAGEASAQIAMVLAPRVVYATYATKDFPDKIRELLSIALPSKERVDHYSLLDAIHKGIEELVFAQENGWKDYPFMNPDGMKTNDILYDPSTEGMPASEWIKALRQRTALYEEVLGLRMVFQPWNLRREDEQMLIQAKRIGDIKLDKVCRLIDIDRTWLDGGKMAKSRVTSRKTPRIDFSARTKKRKRSTQKVPSKRKRK